LRVGDLRNPQAFREKLEAYRTARFRRLAEVSPAQTETVTQEYLGYGEALDPFIADTHQLLHERLEAGDSLLFEGAQGTLLDLDHGTYPFVTSSNSSAGGACTGTGIGPARITGVLGVFKAYCSRVGSGPFPTEQKGEAGDRIRERGREYGTVTGRPRRCGWFDGVLGRYAVRVNSMDCAALTLLDVLDEFEHVPLAIAYEHQGERLATLPSDLETFGRCQPVYEVFPGWRQAISQVRRFEDLPGACRAYIDRLEKLLGCEIALVSVGPERAQTLRRPGHHLERWLPHRS
jgi:adenylosuccinate synthase